MSEIAKCPCCGGELVMDEEGDALHCCGCFFACEPKYIHRIAAAIELARKLKELSQCDINTQHTHVEKQVEAAERRVLEVFK